MKCGHYSQLLRVARPAPGLGPRHVSSCSCALLVVAAMVGPIPAKAIAPEQNDQPAIMEEGNPAEENNSPAPGGDAPPETTRVAAETIDTVQPGQLEPGVTVTGPETIPPYTPAELDAVRAKHGLPPMPSEAPRRARWRCLIADPTCGTTIEVTATSAYVRRFAQVSSSGGNTRSWNSGRADYSVTWLTPALSKTVGRQQFNLVSMGATGGVIVAEDYELWGKMGFASRFWLGRGAWSPALEFQSGLSFLLRTRANSEEGPSAGRSPVGFHADVGLNIGGWGAVVLGGQYETPLARNDVPAALRTRPGGALFIGFRGNLLWGAPVAAAITTQALTQRLVESD